MAFSGISKILHKSGKGLPIPNYDAALHPLVKFFVVSFSSYPATNKFVHIEYFSDAVVFGGFFLAQKARNIAAMAGF